MLEAIWAVDPRQAVTRQFTLAGELGAQLRTTDFFVRTVGLFALLALLLGVLGIYAVASLRQQQRIREFGVRLALGAKPAVLARGVLLDAMRTVALGLLAGLLGTWVVLQFIADQLFGLERSLPLVIFAGSCVIAIAAVVASLVPAMRAALTDPMNALRQE